jgi:hypothetical protein
MKDAEIDEIGKARAKYGGADEARARYGDG